MRQTAEQRADSEKRHCCEIELTRREARHEIRGARDHDPVDQEEDGRQPLTGRGVNMQIGHDAWQSRTEDCLVDVTEEAAQHHQVDGCTCSF